MLCSIAFFLVGLIASTFIRESNCTQEIILDLGAAFFKVGTIKQGNGNFIDMILNSQSKRLTATNIVYDGEVYFVGEYASNGLKRQFPRNFREGKQFVHSILDFEDNSVDLEMNPSTLVSAVVTHIRTNMLGLNMQETFTPEEMQRMQYAPRGMKVYKTRGGGMSYRSADKADDAKEEHVNVTLVVPTGTTHEQLHVLKSAVESVPNTHLVAAVTSASAVVVSYMSGRISYLREQKLPHSERVLVVDIGAGTTEISAVETLVHEPAPKKDDTKKDKGKNAQSQSKKFVDVTLLSSDKFSVGGNDITKEFVDLCLDNIYTLAFKRSHISKDAREKYYPKVSNALMNRIYDGADKAKRVLAVNPETQTYAENVVVSIVSKETDETVEEIDLDDVPFVYTREMLDTIAADLYRDQLKSTFAEFAKWLADNSVDFSSTTSQPQPDKDGENKELKNIDVLLFGGGSRVVAVQALIEETLSEALASLGYKPNLQKTVNTDEAAVIGAGFVTIKNMRGFRLMYHFSAFDLPYEKRTTLETEWLIPAEEEEEAHANAKTNEDEESTEGKSSANNAEKKQEYVVVAKETTNPIHVGEKVLPAIPISDIFNSAPATKNNAAKKEAFDEKKRAVNDSFEKRFQSEEGVPLRFKVYDGRDLVSTKICYVNTKFDEDYGITRPEAASDENATAPAADAASSDKEDAQKKEGSDSAATSDKKPATRTPVADLFRADREQKLVARATVDIYGDVSLLNAALISSVSSEEGSNSEKKEKKGKGKDKDKDKDKDADANIIRHMNIIRCDPVQYNLSPSLKTNSDKVNELMVTSYTIVQQRHDLESALNKLETDIYSANAMIEENYDSSYVPEFKTVQKNVATATATDDESKSPKESDDNTDTDANTDANANADNVSSEVDSSNENVETESVEITDVFIRHSEYNEIKAVLAETSAFVDNMIYNMDPCGPNKACVEARLKDANESVAKMNSVMSPIKERQMQLECREGAVSSYNDSFKNVLKQVESHKASIYDTAFVESWKHKCQLLDESIERIEREKLEAEAEEAAKAAAAADETDEKTEEGQEVANDDGTEASNDSEEQHENGDNEAENGKKEGKKSWLKNIFSKSKSEKEPEKEPQKEQSETAEKETDKVNQSIETAKKLCKRIQDDYDLFDKNYAATIARSNADTYLDKLNQEPKRRPETTCKDIESESTNVKTLYSTESNRIKRDIDIDSKTISKNEYIGKLVQEELKVEKAKKESEAQAKQASNEKNTEQPESEQQEPEQPKPEQPGQQEPDVEGEENTKDEL